MTDTIQEKRSGKKEEQSENQLTYLPPYEQTSVPSSAMLGHIEMLFVLLENKGVDVTAYRSNRKYKTRYAESKHMIHALHKLAREHGIMYEGRKMMFVNLCRDKKTKKKIKYKTSYRLGHPKGYEYMGTLSQTVVEESEENNENEVRARDDNGL